MTLVNSRLTDLELLDLTTRLDNHKFRVDVVAAFGASLYQAENDKKEIRESYLKAEQEIQANMPAHCIRVHNRLEVYDWYMTLIA